MKTGPLYQALKESTRKIKVLQGGTSSGKTVGILQFLAAERAAVRKDLIITVAGQDMPNLKKGSMRDFERFVLSDAGIAAQVAATNKSDHLTRFRSNSIFEFAAFGDEQDAKNGKRNILFMNEVNGIAYPIAWQLMLRTYDEIYMDYNPNSEFWVHENLLSGNNKEFAGKVDLFITDHRHNPFLSEEEHESIESISDPDMWKVYARGLTGKIKGLVFGHFRPVQSPPETYDRIIWGIDYGYTNDPTAIVKIWCAGRQRYVQELSYTPGISDEQILGIVHGAGWQHPQPIYSEADPNMINQLRIKGLPVVPAIKGPGSVAAGISKVKEHECFYLPGENMEMELKNYKWVMSTDLRTGKEVMTNQPVDADNHLCDATRYAIYTDSFHNR